MEADLAFQKQEEQEEQDKSYLKVIKSLREGCFKITARYVVGDEQSFDKLLNAVLERFPLDPEMLQRAHGVREDEPVFVELDVPLAGCSFLQVCNIIRGIGLEMGFNIAAE